MDDEKKLWVWDELWKIKKVSMSKLNYKKKMGLGQIMEDKKIISIKRIMEDLINEQKK